MILKIQNLKVYFPVSGGKLFLRKRGDIKAVDDVNLSIKKGKIIGLVGESGCGKTTLARAVVGLAEKTSGKIFFDDINLDEIPKDIKQELKRKIQMIFQDPYLSLNPTMRVVDVVAEGLDVHGLVRDKEEREERVISLMETAELPDAAEILYRYPAAFSAGERQRIAIARALAVNPFLLLCDEPVSSLDVLIQDEILKLFLSLRDKFNLSILFISHDLAVVSNISDEVIVMYLGRIVEYAARKELFTNPLHPYTKLLLSTVPIPDPLMARGRVRRDVKEEIMVSAENIPPGCRFHPRCPAATKLCQETDPGLVDRGGGHLVACHLI